MKNWETKKLGEVCDIVNGFTPLKSNRKFWDDGDIPWFTIDDIRKQGRIIENAEQKITKTALGNNNKRLLPAETILLCCTASVGEYAITKISLTTNQQFNGLVIKDKNTLSPMFLFYFSQILKNKLLKLSGKTTIDFIPISRLKNIEVSYPPLSEQHRLVKILDSSFAKIEQVKSSIEKNLQSTKELFESYSKNIFENKSGNWEEKRLEELGTITSSKRIYKKEYVKNGIPFYRIKEIKELAHDKSATLELYISTKRYEEIKNMFGVPQIGDVLMTAVGTIGEIYVVKNNNKFYFKDGNILWFKNFDSINPYFLKYVLMSFIRQINKLSQGSTYSALTIEKIQKHKVSFPKSLSEQRKIVSHLDSLSSQTKKLESIYQQKLADLEELKKSILAKAFAGEL